MYHQPNQNLMEMTVAKGSDITSFEQTIKQVPSVSNDFVGITNTSISTSSRHLSYDGIATAEDVSSNNPSKILEYASTQSMAKINDVLANISSSQQSLEHASRLSPPVIQAQVIDTFAVHNNMPQRSGNHIATANAYSRQDNQVQERYNHNPNKSMSDKQRGMLMKMASEKGIDLEGVTQRIAGKRFISLSSLDANNVIKALRTS